MEASALRHAARVPVLTGLSPHLRLQSDERLVALVRRGQQAAFEALVRRYHPRLLAFCRHMLGSNEDAEDVLQEVFTSAYNAICADERPIKARPWLYRIARNRCLNHLRRPRDAGHESMDVFEREAGATAADTVHRREEFRRIVADVRELPETQRTALLLREMDNLSYDQIAEAMETSVSSVKSLLVRARMSLAEASEARQLTCGEVRLQLSQAVEGIARPAAPTRRHVRSCPRCRSFRRELRRTSHALAAVYPVGVLAAAKSFAGGGSAATGAGAGATAGAGSATAGAGGVGGMLSAVGGSLVAKTAAGLATAALVTAGAAEVRSGGEAEPGPASGPREPVVTSADQRPRPSSDSRRDKPTANRGERSRNAASRDRDNGGARRSQGRPVTAGPPEGPPAPQTAAPVAPSSAHPVPQLQSQWEPGSDVTASPLASQGSAHAPQGEQGSDGWTHGSRVPSPAGRPASEEPPKEPEGAADDAEPPPRSGASSPGRGDPRPEAEHTAR